MLRTRSVRFARLIFLALSVLVVLISALPAEFKPALIKLTEKPDPPTGSPTPPTSLGKGQQDPGLPLSFETNQGQAEPTALFLSRGSGYRLFLTSTEAVMLLPGPFRGDQSEAVAGTQPPFRMEFVGAGASPVVEGLDPLSGKVHYLIGTDPGGWRTNIPTYSRVRYRDLYPGVDLVFRGTRRYLEAQFIVAPGSDPTAVVLRLEGLDPLELVQGSDVLAHGPAAHLQQVGPEASQQEVPGTRRAVQSRYVVRGRNEVGIEVGQYDPMLPL